MKKERRGRYYRSLKEYMQATGKTIDRENTPSIDVTGSVYGMRKLYWGFECDVVRIGHYIYKAN